MEDIYSKIKEELLQRENLLSPNATKSMEAIRINNEEESKLRPEFFKDTDRILHSLAYSRYIDKTQVFILNENDHITHRIIHVALVSKIARTIGRALNLNEDLIEAMAIGHDIGHTPFGHLGESFLNEISLKEDKTMFNHNVQSVRNFLTIENDGKGSNLCLQTLDGIMCHNGEILNNVYKPKSKTKEDFLKEYEASYIDKEVLKTLRPMTLEGCVVRISDIIGYIGRDIEDAIKLNVLKREDLPNEIILSLGDNNKDIVNNIILDIVKNSYQKPYIKMSEEVFKSIKKLKSFNYENIYDKAHTKEAKELYKKIFNDLFYFYKESLERNDKEVDIVKHYYNEMSEDYRKNNSYNRIVIDYIAGSTDDYLINQYNKYIK